MWTPNLWSLNFPKAGTPPFNGLSSHSIHHGFWGWVVIKNQEEGMNYSCLILFDFKPLNSPWIICLIKSHCFRWLNQVKPIRYSHPAHRLDSIAGFVTLSTPACRQFQWRGPRAINHGDSPVNIGISQWSKSAHGISPLISEVQSPFLINHLLLVAL